MAKKGKKAKVARPPPQIPETVPWMDPELPPQPESVYLRQITKLEQKLYSIQNDCDSLKIQIRDVQEKYDAETVRNRDIEGFHQHLIRLREVKHQRAKDELSATLLSGEKLLEQNAKHLDEMSTERHKIHEQLKSRYLDLRMKLTNANPEIERKKKLLHDFTRLKTSIAEQDEEFYNLLQKSVMR